MNKVYGLAWNAVLGAWVAVSEISRSRRKSSGRTGRRQRLAGTVAEGDCLNVVDISFAPAPPPPRKSVALALGMLLTGLAGPVWAQAVAIENGMDIPSVSEIYECGSSPTCGIDSLTIGGSTGAGSYLTVEPVESLSVSGGVITVGGTGEAGSLSTGGSLTANSGIQINANGTLSFTGGTLDAGVAGFTVNGTFNVGAGGTITGDIATTALGSLIFNHTGSLGLANAISGTGSIMHTAGTTILTGDSSAFNGTTTINGGTLRLGTGSQLGNGNVSLGVNGTLDFARNAITNFGNVFSGNGHILHTSGETTLTGDSSGFTGYTTVGSGSTLRLGTGGRLGNSIIVDGGGTPGTFDFAHGETITVSNVFSGGGHITHTNGTTTLTGNSTGFSGTTYITNNTRLNLGDGTSANGALGGTINIESGSTLGLNHSGNWSSAAVFAGNGEILHNAGTTTLTGNSSSFAGTTNIHSGTTLNLGTGGRLGGTTNVTTGATLGMTAANNTAATVNVASGGTLKISGTGANITTLTVNGSALDFSGASIGSTTPLLTVTNLDRMGTNTLDATDLVFNNSTVFAQLLGWDNVGLETTLLSAASVTGTGSLDIAFTAGTLDVMEAGAKVATAYYDGTINVTNPALVKLDTTLTQLDLENGETLTLNYDGNTGDHTLSAQITGTGNLAINAGAGRTIIIGDDTLADNSYTGTTTVKTGTLQAGEDDALGTAASHTAELVIEANAAFDLNGKSQTIDELTVNAGTDTAGAGEFDFAGGALTLKSGGSSRGELTGDGALILDGGTFSVSGAYTAPGANPLPLAGLLVDTTINTGAELKIQGQSSFGDGSGSITFTNANSTLTFARDITASPYQHPTGELKNDLVSSGMGNEGIVTLNDLANLTLKGNNLAFGGVFEVTEKATLTVNESTATDADARFGAAAIKDSGAVILTVDNAYTFKNELTGAGTLEVTTGSHTFEFDATAATSMKDGFTGTVELNASAFLLEGNNTTALSNAAANLVVNEGAVVTVGQGIQDIGYKLTLNGGTLVFGNVLWPSAGALIQEEADNFIKVGALDISRGGTVQVNIQGTGTLNDPTGITNLLEQDDPNRGTKLIAADVAEGDTDKIEGGSAGAVRVECVGGTGCATINSQAGVNITQNSDVVATADYGLRLTVAAADPYQLLGADTDYGLYISYGLTDVTIQNGKTLVLANNNPSTANPNARDLSAALHGDASTTLRIGDGAPSDNYIVSLSNLTNDYRGATYVDYGTLATNNDHVLGNTRLLQIADDATVLLRNDQRIGTLNIETGGLLNLTGTLTIVDSQHVDANGVSLDHETLNSGGELHDNMITGAGALHLSNMNMTAEGNNTDDVTNYTGEIRLDRGSTLTVYDMSAIGNSATAQGIVLAGANDLLLFTGVNGGDADTTVNMQRTLSGDGTVRLTNDSNVTLSKDNHTWAVNQDYGTVENKFFSGLFDVQGGTTLSAIISSTGNGADSEPDPVTGAITPGADQDPFGTAAIHIAAGGTVNVNGKTDDDTYSFDHALTGAGTLAVDFDKPGGDTFNFIDPTGGQFTGTVIMDTPDFNLANTDALNTGTCDNNGVDANCANTTALTNATLQVEAGSTTHVGSGEQAIGSLTFNGGTVDFRGSNPGDIQNDASIKIKGVLDMSAGGTVKIDADNYEDAGEGRSTTDNQHNILAQDDTVNTQIFTGATQIVGSITDLTLVDGAGVPLGAGVQVGITQTTGGNATGTYNYALTQTADGFAVSHDLTQLQLNSGGFVLAEDLGATGAAADLNARITGAGNLVIAAANQVTLSNSANDYTGSTTAKSGTLKMNTDHALGDTRDLIINAGASVDVNGKTQTIGALHNGAAAGSTATLNLHGGDLTITGGGYSYGTLTGSGDLTATGGTLVIDNNNTNFSADTTIENNATIRLEHLGGLGTSEIDDQSGGILAFGSGSNGSFGNTIKGAGDAVVLASAVVNVTGDNSDFSGEFRVANTGELIAAEQKNLGTAAIDDQAGGLVTLKGYEGTLNNNISGTGTVQLTDDAEVTLTGDNTYFSGLFDVNDDTNLNVVASNLAEKLGTATVNIDADGQTNLIPTGGSALTFDNALTGTGTLYVETGGTNAFNFGATAGSAFAGTVELKTGTFEISGPNATALTNATLQIDAGNVTTVGAGNPTIGGLTFDGGTLYYTDINKVPFDPVASVLTVGTLDVSGTGTVSADIETSYIQPAAGVFTGNPFLLEHDEGQVGTKLVAATTVIGMAGNIKLVDASGNPVSDDDLMDINQPSHEGDKVAVGTYGLRLTTTGATGNGLYVNYGLKILDLQAGKSTWLYQQTGLSGVDADMSAQVIGSGHLVIDALQGTSDTVSLSNSTNAYTGTTTVKTGTLLTRNDFVLGHTSRLTIESGATVALQGGLGVPATEQNVGALFTEAGGRLDIGAGSQLNIKDTLRNPGEFYGGYIAPDTLFGAGRLVIDPSWLDMDGAQTSWTGTIQVGLPTDTQSVYRAINDASMPGTMENWAFVQVGGAGCCTLGEYAGIAPTTLTVGSWEGRGGKLILGTWMGDDTSPTDQLIIDGGAATGDTGVIIKKRGGAGAQTNVGIPVIETTNGGTTDADAFHLDSASEGYRGGGNPGIVAGPFVYRLLKGGNGGNAENWYLVSMPGYSAEVGGYLENRYAAMGMMTEHTFHDRQSHTFGLTDANNANRALWARFDHSTNSRDLGNGLKSRTRQYRLHAGLDIARFDTSDGGDFRVGAMLLHGESHGHINSAQDRDARHRTNVEAGGLYATWHGERDQAIGPYVDAWFLTGRVEARVHGDDAASDRYKSRGTALSLEAGYAFKIQESNQSRWFLEPQAQVIYTRYRAGSHVNDDGIEITGSSDNARTTRLGVRLMGEYKKDNGNILRPFAVFNWWHDTASNTMKFDDIEAGSHQPEDRAELKIGLEGQVSPNLSLWGSLGAQSDFGDYHQGTLQLGLRYRW
jgi:autotransporter family porin